MKRNTDSEEELRAVIQQTPRLQQPTDPLKVIVFGRDRTGKSALVNSLLGQGFAEESDPQSSRCSVRAYGRTLDTQLSVVIFDTPSLGAIDRKTDDILDEVATKTQGSADLVVFCIDMRGRLNRGDVDCMNQIAQKYGKCIWERGIVVLTFGNEFVQPHGAGDYMEKWTEMKSTIQKLLHKEVGLSFKIVNSIPVLPVGYKNDPILHDKENWNIRFWISALNLIQHVNSRAILIAENNPDTLLRTGLTNLRGVVVAGYNHVRGVSDTLLRTGLTKLRDVVVAGYNHVRGIMNLKVLAGGSIVVIVVVVMLILYQYSRNLAATMTVSMLVDHPAEHTPPPDKLYRN